MVTAIAAALLMLGLLLSSCVDQPIDDDGTANFDTTIVRVHDTIVINGSDTVVVTRVDTIFRDRLDTIKVIEVRRDTIRDTLRDFHVDTIEVPIRSGLFRSAKLVYPARVDSGGRTGPVEDLQIDVSDWIQYNVVDSGGTVVGVGVSMSAAIPLRYHGYAVGINPNAVPFHLHGVTLFLPTTRIVSDGMGAPDTISLRDHPFAPLAGATGRGGIVLTVLHPESKELETFWTGQTTEISTPNGGERLVSNGVVRIGDIDTVARRIYLYVEARIFLRSTVNGVTTAQQAPVTLALQLGY
jgi:hypothetical protein